MSRNPATELPRNRRANKAELAAWFGVSLPAVDAWIRRGCPTVQRGARGVPWVFDLLEVAQWRFGGLPAGDGEGIDPDSLSPTDQRAWWQARNEQLKHDEAAGNLIAAEDVHREFAGLAKLFTATADSLPDILERDAGIDPEAVQRVQEVMDGFREQVYHQLVGAESERSDEIP